MQNPIKHERDGDYCDLPNPSGFKISGWTDLAAIIMIVMSMVGGIAWGIKLEISIQEAREDIRELKHAIEPGILKITRERLDALDRDHRWLMNTHTRDIERLQDAVTKLNDKAISNSNGK